VNIKRPVEAGFKVRRHRWSARHSWLERAGKSDIDPPILGALPFCPRIRHDRVSVAGTVYDPFDVRHDRRRVDQSFEGMLDIDGAFLADCSKESGFCVLPLGIVVGMSRQTNDVDRSATRSVAMNDQSGNTQQFSMFPGRQGLQRGVVAAKAADGSPAHQVGTRDRLLRLPGADWVARTFPVAGMDVVERREFMGFGFREKNTAHNSNLKKEFFTDA
jgi:hypothetical protein